MFYICGELKYNLYIVYMARWEEYFDSVTLGIGKFHYTERDDKQKCKMQQGESLRDKDEQLSNNWWG